MLLGGCAWSTEIKLPARAHILSGIHELQALHSQHDKCEVLCRLLVVLNPNLQWCQTLSDLQGRQSACSLVIVVAPQLADRVLQH
eukprot:3307154-Amphidinium_carterae.1